MFICNNYFRIANEQFLCQLCCLLRNYAPVVEDKHFNLITFTIDVFVVVDNYT